MSDSFVIPWTSGLQSVHGILQARILDWVAISFSLAAQTVKNLPAMQEIWVRSLGQEDPLEKEMATRSSNLAWRIPRTEDYGGPTVHGVAKNRTQLSNIHFSLSPGDLPNPGTEHASPALAGRFLTTEPPGKPKIAHTQSFILIKWQFHVTQPDIVI